MSGRFVRASSYRHVFGNAAKREGTYEQLRMDVSGNGAHISANHKFFAVSLQGGGGPVLIHPLSEVGRIDRNAPKIAVHKGTVLATEFSPFASMVATVSEDCLAKVTLFPDAGLNGDIEQANVTLEGHQKKVTDAAWHKTAANILATGAADNLIKIWDVQSQAEVLNYELRDNPYSLDWNIDGSLFLVSAKDKLLHVYDPRNPGGAQTTESFGGSKQTSAKWADSLNQIVATGFSANSMRQYRVWDVRNLAKPLTSADMDQSAGVLITHYDPDNSVLYMGGKGDAGIKYFEVEGAEPYVHFLTEFRGNGAQKGLCFVPKPAMNTKPCEIARALRVLRDSVEPVSFCVPRKSEMFQADIFPDTIKPVATGDAAGYLAGRNFAPQYMSLDPKKREDLGDLQAAAPAFEARARPAAAAGGAGGADLQAQLNAAHARIRELEAEVARLKA